MEEQLTQSQPHSITDLHAKMHLEGVVKETDIHGAIVDIGVEYDGLLHISQLSTKKINRVGDKVKPGDKIEVWVTKVDPAHGHISLTMIEPPALDWREITEGKVYTGKVTRIEPYGAFVDIGAERAGLLHVREMSDSYVRHPTEIVQIGDEIEVRVLKFDRRKRRIDLTMQDSNMDITEIFDGEEEPSKTTMEIAIRQAQQQRARTRERRHKKHRSPDLSERESILARTLEQHHPDS